VQQVPRDAGRKETKMMTREMKLKIAITHFLLAAVMFAAGFAWGTEAMMSYVKELIK
jgi:hypothetical protein